ncbi:MAG: hypothetical protein IPQ27_10870 [Chitinophagaceae bacterium]|nr:hypothetical protein [Chitinophagaceae bacterium]
MRYLYTLFFCIFFKGILAQKIVQVGTGEYYTAYLTDSGSVYIPISVGNRYFCKQLNSPEIFTNIACGLAQAIATNTQGEVFIIGPGKTGRGIFAGIVAKDITGKNFTGVEKVYAIGNTFFALKKGKPFVWGEDILYVNGGKNIIAPFPVPVPANVTFTKLVPLSFDNSSVLALASNGTVWKYSRNVLKPAKINIPGLARDITGIGSGVYVVETSIDLYAWGFLGSYLGVGDMGHRPVSIKSKWEAAGCRFPAKQISGNYGTLHILDANNNLFGAGDNVHGDVGNGRQWPDWSSYAPLPYSWSYAHGQLIQKPVQITGKFNKICTAPNNVFYMYAQDMGGNWYSWGRNKARSLGNGITLTPMDEARYPEALNIPAPELVDPINTKWRQIASFDPDERRFPIANAGINQYISSSFTTLSAAFSSQQKGSINSFLWQNENAQQAAVIESPADEKTKVHNLQQGENSFKLTVINNYGDSASTTVKVFVN